MVAFDVALIVLVVEGVEKGALFAVVTVDVVGLAELKTLWNVVNSGGRRYKYGIRRCKKARVGEENSGEVGLEET